MNIMEPSAPKPKPGAKAKAAAKPRPKAAKAAGAEATAKRNKPNKPDKKGIKACVHFSQEIADEIAVRTSLGESLRTIAADPTMPTMRAIVGWQREYPAFAAQLDEAR